MSKQTDFNCCDLCHNLKIGDLVTIGLGTTTVIVGSVINRVCSNDCEHLIISAESLSVNGCRDINMIIKSLSSLA